MTSEQDGPGPAGGFSVLDGAALVAGASVAAVQIRGVFLVDLMGRGWVVMWGTFFWVAVTAAGPFVYGVRGFVRPDPGHPRVGEVLWGILGLPWLCAAPLQKSPLAGEPAANELFSTVLSVTLGAACLVAVAVVWATWVVVPAHRASRTFAGPWTNRVGLVLAIAWPVQCGVGLVVIG